jgi:hypothetical protein
LGQGVHVAAPAADVLPAAQRVHLVEFALLNVLAAQVLQAAGKTLDAAMKVPSAHTTQEPVGPSAWKEPARHVAAHAVPSERGAKPAAQAAGRLAPPAHAKPPLVTPAVALHA